MELLVLAVILLLLGAFSILAMEYGVDSRDGSDDPHRSIYPIGLS